MTLTLKLVYNGRDDLTLNMVYTVVVKADNTPPAMDYQALLETAVRENFHKLMGSQSRVAAKAAGRAVDVSADDFDDED